MTKTLQQQVRSMLIEYNPMNQVCTDTNVYLDESRDIANAMTSGNTYPGFVGDIIEFYHDAQIGTKISHCIESKIMGLS